MIGEDGLLELRKKWGAYPGYSSGGFKDILDTAETLWKIVRAAQHHIKTHGHTSDVMLEDALIDAGLSDPALAAWRKKK